MRTELFKLIKEQMHRDESLFLLVADMGFGYIEPIRNEFPDRFLNVGISEQNLIGIAAGLSNVGYRPICYTISNFLIQRGFEQIRDDLCIHHIPAILIGTSTGFDNGYLGPSHQIIDDFGCLKSFPYIEIYSPSSIESIREIFKDVILNKNPTYIRIGKGSFHTIPLENTINHMVYEDDTSHNLVITHGSMLENCISAHKLNKNFSIYCMNKIKPIDESIMCKLFKKYKDIFVVEDHFSSSGLYNSLCMIEHNSTHIHSLGVPDIYEHRIGDSNYFLNKYGLTPEQIAMNIRRIGWNQM